MAHRNGAGVARRICPPTPPGGWQILLGAVRRRPYRPVAGDRFVAGGDTGGKMNFNN